MRATVPLPGDQASLLAQASADIGIPGLAIALAAPGRKTLFVHGVAQAGLARPVDEDTWFSVASLGKHVTAAALLDLAQRGALDLTAPIGRYLTDAPAPWANRSVLSLLRHTSGLPEYLTPSPDDAAPTGRADFMDRYRGLLPTWAENEAWMYTNTNYILAGMLVGELARRPYADVVQTLFERLACPGATVGSPQWVRSTVGPHAGTAPRDTDSVRREVIGDGDACFTPAGALRWLEVLLDGGLLDASHTRLMFSAGTLATGRPCAYGCGWFLEPLGAGVLAHHAGHFDGFTAMAILNPSRGTGVIALCNQAPGHTRAVRHLAQTALELFAPGSTPLALPVLHDDDPALLERVRTQLIRAPGSAADPSCLADELRRVAEHGSPVRTVPNLFAGRQPDRFDLVQRNAHPTHQWHRYRLNYADRIEHVLVGTAADGRIFWAWAL